MSKNKESKQMKQSKPRQKQIKLSHIETQHKQINKMETYVLDEEQNLVLKYYPIFPENKIQELLTELHEAVVFVEEQKLDFFTDDFQFMKFLYLLIAKKMTSLDSEIPSDFHAQVSILNQIIDVGLFKTIFDEVLDGSEVMKVMDRVEEFSKNANMLNDAIQKELVKLEKLQNKDILSTPFNVLVSPTDVIQ